MSLAILLDEANRFSNPADMSLLRELFGPSRAEIWRQLANEIDANYVEGDFWTQGKVQASHAGWLITLEKHGKLPARMRAPFLNPGGFRFTVYRKGVFTDLGKFMGMQDVEVGHPDFDRDFVIKGTDAAKLRQIFGKARIRELIAAQPRVHFEVKRCPQYLRAKFSCRQTAGRFRCARICGGWRNRGSGASSAFVRSICRNT